MGGFKNDQATKLNIKDSDIIKSLRREIAILRSRLQDVVLKEKINKLNDINNRTIDEDKPDSINL